ncbi:MAG TPA: hypothetical protein ENO05_07385 [Bacteroides sp.]|nr:hypothetical protein [Bacteroides sp.]
MKLTSLLTCLILAVVAYACNRQSDADQPLQAEFNTTYTGERLNRIAFPMGGIGAGMICLEGNGCISHVSVRHHLDIFHQPFMFGAVAVRGLKNGAKVLEGPVQDFKLFGSPYTGNGSSDSNYGFPRFEEAEFLARFPFATIRLKDGDIPLDVSIRGWSPFIPGDEDNSSLPVAALEYTFTNLTDSTLEMVFSYHARNFMRIRGANVWGPTYPEKGHSIRKMEKGFILAQECLPDKPHYKGDFAIFTPEDARVDYRWFRGGWYDGRTMLWKDIGNMEMPADTATEGSAEASLYVPLTLQPGETKTIPLLMCWYVPHSDTRYGALAPVQEGLACDPVSGCCSPEYTSQFYEPWYSGTFGDITGIAQYWLSRYEELLSESEKFSSTFFSSDLPPEVLEAVSANLTILKSPTVLRQKDGRLWAYEGCFDSGSGCCPGSCTHVWNYAQAIPHLFPYLERTLRETEFSVSQDEKGHQTFRSALPIQETAHDFHAAADGQLGGIMKVYREWRISGDTEWLRGIWPQVKKSYHYCSSTWDPEGKGILEEPHHNTYDIEFWGPDGMCTSIYLGATFAMIRMAEAVGEESDHYRGLLGRGTTYMQDSLFNGEYFIQKTTWRGLRTPAPDEQPGSAWNIDYSEEALELLKTEGPKYQYGTGCLSDGVIGAWFDAVCGLPEVLDREKVRSHLRSVHRYNFRKDLTDHVNPQRPGFACGSDGGLLLCTWPRGGMPSLPFVYSNEVWTGIEYQVASHLMIQGEVDMGLEIVREVRRRYDGTMRNPFNEYECGHWYARALSSYALIQGLTGFFYDAVTSTLVIDSRIGNDFKCFISAATGYGLAGLRNGEPFVEVVSGSIPVDRFVNGKGEEL